MPLQQFTMTYNESDFLRRIKLAMNWKTWNRGASTFFKCKLLHCTVVGDCCRGKLRKFSIAPITWHTVRWNSSLLFFHLLLVLFVEPNNWDNKRRSALSLKPIWGDDLADASDTMAIFICGEWLVTAARSRYVWFGRWTTM